MKTKYKYIHFENTIDLDKDGLIVGVQNDTPSNRKLYECINNRTGSHLASIAYYRPWKEWIAVINDGCLFSQGCLLDIADFVKQLNEAQL